MRGEMFQHSDFNAKFQSLHDEYSLDLYSKNTSFCWRES